MVITGLRWLRVQNLNQLALGGYLLLGMGVLQSGAGPMARLCLAAAVLIGLLAWAAALRRARAIDNIATARIASAAQGYAKVQGRASVDASNLIVSPVSQRQCVWYRYRIYEKGDSDKEWNEVDKGCSTATFEIVDTTGACRIDPDHAEVMGAEEHTRYDGDNKTVEELLHGGCMLYVLGEFSTLGGANSVLSLRDDVSTLLAEWKADSTEMRRRFDLNHDGEVNLAEWELARRLATKTVEQQHRELRAQPGVHMVRAPPDGRLFLVSALDPQRLRKRYLLWSGLHLAVAVAATLGFTRLLLI